MTGTGHQTDMSGQSWDILQGPHHQWDPAPGSCKGIKK